MPRDNERLEFLGDAVLGLRVAERLIGAFPQSSEGELTRLRAWLVSARHLAQIGERLALGPQLRLGKAEESIGGRGKQRVLANCVEAILAAIQLDGGYTAAARFVDLHVIGDQLTRLVPGRLDEFAYKSALQEWAHREGRARPAYAVVEESGPEHEKLFRVEVVVGDLYRGQAAGTTKKQAEQEAARQALAQLGITQD